MLLSVAQHVKSILMAALSFGIILIVIADTLLMTLEPTIFGPRFQIHFFGPLFNPRYMQLVPATVTIAILGVNAVLLSLFLVCTWKIPRKDIAKPFLCTLSIALALATAGIIALFALKLTYVSNNILYYAWYLSFTGQFTCLNFLLFGGSFFLIGGANAVRTGDESAGKCAWVIHGTIAIISLLIAIGNGANIINYGSIFKLIFKVSPMIGIIFLLIGIAIGYLLITRDKKPKPVENVTSVKSSLTKLICFFAAPAVMILLTRGVNGARVLISLMGGNDIYYAVASASYPLIPGAEQIEMYLPIAIVLSALVFLPQVKLLPFRRAFEKTAIAPVEDISNQTPAVPQPMMMMAPPMMSTPSHQMMMHQHMITPSQHPIMGPHDTIPATLPTFHPYPLKMHGMGGPPAYMMA